AWVDSRGVQFFATSREGDPTGDPNDAAIFREARRLLSSPVDIIALLVQDKDFIELARDISGQRKDRTRQSSERRKTYPYLYPSPGAPLLGPPRSPSSPPLDSPRNPGQNAPQERS
ncbi:unnamed protein product, partial [Prorocentrum cordatum]